jgi:hypothetical protein
MSRRERYTNPFAATGGHSPALYASMGVPIGTPIGISPYGNPMIGGFGIPVIQQPIQQSVYRQQNGIYDPFKNDYPADAPISRSQYHEMQRMATAYHTGERNWSSNPFDDGQYTYANHALFETPQTRQSDRQMYRTYEDNRRTAHQNAQSVAHPRAENRCEPKCKSFLNKVRDRLTSSKNQYLQEGKLSNEEREYAENSDNYENTDDFDDIQKRIKKGDDYALCNDTENEAHFHRSAQEQLYKLTKNKFKKNKNSRQAYAWNSLCKHSPLTINHLIKKYELNDCFYYCSRDNHYYVTEKAKQYLDKIGHDYSTSGVSSIVNNKPPKKIIYTDKMCIPGHCAIY